MNEQVKNITICDYDPSFVWGVRNLLFFEEGRLRQKSINLLFPGDDGKLKNSVKAVVALDKSSFVAGYSAMSEDGEFSIVVVHPFFRKRGIATELLKTQIQKNGLRKVRIGATNVASIKVAIKAGFILKDAGIWSDNGKAWLDFELPKPQK